MRRNLLLLATALTAAQASLATPSPPAPAPPPADRAAVLVLRDGALAALEPGRAPEPAQREALEHAWVWSERSTPRHVPAGRFDAGPPPEDRARLAVTVTRGPEPSPDCLLVAAPVEMWEEVPEELLPGWAVPKSGKVSLPLDPARPWRLRLVECDGGSWWHDLPAGRSAVSIAASRAAETLAVQVVDPAGRPLPAASLALLPGGPAKGHARRFAGFRGDVHGIVTIPDLPPAAELTALFEEPEHLPAAFAGRPGSLPRKVTLAAGAVLSGRFVDGGGAPLGGVEVAVESWASGSLPAVVTRRTESGEDGRFAVRPVPRSAVALLATAAGRAPYRARLEVDRPALDLGAITLAPAVSLAVEVVDDLGAPVAGAEISAGPGLVVTTDARGRARLSGLHPTEPADLTASARGHLEGTARVPLPRPELLTVRLGRAFRVTARFLDADGVPVESGKVRIHQGASFTDRELEPGGRLAADLEPGAALELAFSSPASRELAVPVAPGAPGESRDLGDLMAPAGLVVTGRLVAVGGAEPVAGATIWAPRPSKMGPLVAWAHGDLIRAASRTDGTFETAGLPAGPSELRVDAPGFARAAIPIAPTPGQGRLDLGDVTLGRGTTLVVSAAEAENGAEARADLAGRGLELDMLSAPLVDGVAEIRHVPAGRVLVSVRSGRRLVCDEELVIAPEEAEREVDCRKEPLAVRGVVSVGGEPAGGGRLLWLPPAAEVGSTVLNFRTAGGLRQQHPYGAGRPQVAVEIDGRGGFATTELAPGRWRVVWTPESGTASDPREVEIPRDVEEHVMALDYPGAMVLGTVVDADGEPVAGARVQDLDGTAVGFSREDGAFSLVVPPGARRVQARSGELASTIESVEAEPGRRGGAVRLVLERSAADEVAVSVVTEDGRPSAGAFVFLELDGQGLRMISADAAGRAVVHLEPPHPPRVRAAALAGGAWTFGTWRPLETAREGLPLVVSATGSLAVTCAGDHGAPRIVAPDGWDLSRLLLRLGSRPELAPASPLLLQGLPEGTYSVSLGAASSTTAIRAGRQSEIAFE